MVKIFSIIIFALTFFQETAAGSQEIVVVQSLTVKPYEDALRGFKSVYAGKIKKLLLTDTEGADAVRAVRESKPGMILAIGAEALAKVRRIKDIPIVYLMVLNPHAVLQGEENITGISMSIPPEKQLAALQKVLPEVRKVGLLYDPGKTGFLVKKAQLAAKAAGIELVAKEVRRTKDVPELANSMKEHIQVFWMIPDTTVVTPETVNFLLLFSLENRIPMLAFSDKYVEAGALMSLDIDAFNLGKQAGEAAGKILSGADVREIPRFDVKNAVLTINVKTAKKMGITVSDEVMTKARKVR